MRGKLPEGENFVKSRTEIVLQLLGKSFLEQKDTFEFGEIVRIKLFSVFDFLAGLGELIFVVDRKLPDHILFVGGFVLKVRDIVFGHLLDHLIVAQRLSLLEYGRLISSHFKVFIDNR